MAKARSVFACQSCGATAPRWSGRCESCGEWNTLVEEATSAPVAKGAKTGSGRIVKLTDLSGETEQPLRLATGISELDRAAGGGFVPGSAILIGGDPGIGKSTLLLQAAAQMADQGERAVYISGEEAVGQVRMRAERLGVSGSPVMLAAETCVEDILATLKSGPPPSFLILDSIQTLWTSAIDAAPGTVSQVRAAAQTVIRYAKQSNAIVILVGHVTKDGQIAGPRVVEHMVDAVFYFEGERGQGYRILRVNKNRFGPTDEIGVFSMTGEGLKDVSNPSELFLGDRSAAAPGTAVFAGIEGTRPLLVEIQALVSPSNLGTPRRAVIGWDSNRLAMVIAVLEAHCGVRLGQHDIYLNVAGGYRITEPAADCAAAAALVSSLTGRPLPVESVYFGEISLTGTVRSVSQSDMRLREAAKLGFSLALAPLSREDNQKKTPVDVRAIKETADIVAFAAGSADSGAATGQTGT